MSDVALNDVHLYSTIAAARMSAFARALDTKDWTGYRDLYTDDGELHVPWGAAVSKAELAADTEANLGRFDLTQHIITNALAIPDGPRMLVTANLQAVHVYPAELASVDWVVGGRYDAELVLTGDEWLFRRMGITLLWQSGDNPAF